MSRHTESYCVGILCVGILRHTVEAYFAAHGEAYCVGILCVGKEKKLFSNKLVIKNSV